MNLIRTSITLIAGLAMSAALSCRNDDRRSETLGEEEAERSGQIATAPGEEVEREGVETEQRSTDMNEERAAGTTGGTTGGGSATSTSGTTHRPQMQEERSSTEEQTPPDQRATRDTSDRSPTPGT